MGRYSIGIELDEGSARVAVAAIHGGEIVGQALEPHEPRQPQSWVDTAWRACRGALRAGTVIPEEIVGVGVACTSGAMPSVSARLAGQSAELFGLSDAVPIAPPVPHAHAALPGAGVASPSTLVMSIGQTRCVHLLNSRVQASVPGVTGPVRDGILPGYFGYEVVQTLTNDLASNAMELRIICDKLRSAGVQVRRFVAVGTTALESEQMMQTYADVLDARIKLPESDQPVVLGAAILGCLAAGPGRTGFASLSQAIHAMARLRQDLVYRPDLEARKAYDKLYEIRRAHLPIPSDTPNP